MTNFSCIINIIEDYQRISFSQPNFWCLDIRRNRFNPLFDLREIDVLSEGERKGEARNACGSVTVFVFICPVISFRFSTYALTKEISHMTAPFQSISSAFCLDQK